MTRVGIGYDVHRFAVGRRCVIGGVDIPHPMGLSGHSDADVLLHALSDALLGAAGLGDMGRYFPEEDPRWEGVSSLVLLAEVARRLASAGYRVVNADAVVIAEAPRISPHTEKMRANISQTLSIPPDAINVKATTHEQMGCIGRGEGIAAQATCMIEQTR